MADIIFVAKLDSAELEKEITNIGKKVKPIPLVIEAQYEVDSKELQTELSRVREKIASEQQIKFIAVLDSETLEEQIDEINAGSTVPPIKIKTELVIPEETTIAQRNKLQKLFGEKSLQISLEANVDKFLQDTQAKIDSSRPLKVRTNLEQSGQSIDTSDKQIRVKTAVDREEVNRIDEDIEISRDLKINATLQNASAVESQIQELSKPRNVKIYLEPISKFPKAEAVIGTRDNGVTAELSRNPKLRYNEEIFPGIQSRNTLSARDGLRSKIIIDDQKLLAEISKAYNSIVQAILEQTNVLKPKDETFADKIVSKTQDKAVDSISNLLLGTAGKAFEGLKDVLLLNLSEDAKILFSELGTLSETLAKNVASGFLNEIIPPDFLGEGANQLKVAAKTLQAVNAVEKTLLDEETNIQADFKEAINFLLTGQQELLNQNKDKNPFAKLFSNVGGVIQRITSPFTSAFKTFRDASVYSFGSAYGGGIQTKLKERSGFDFGTLGQLSANNLLNGASSVTNTLGITESTEEFNEFINSISEFIEEASNSTDGINLLLEKYKNNIKKNAEKIRQEFDAGNLQSGFDIDPTVEGVTFTTGGFSATGGKGSNAFGRSLEPLLPNQAIVPVSVSNTDVKTNSADNLPKWAAGAISRLSQDMLRGYNKDSVELAKQVYAFAQENPDVPVTLAGYSVGGIVSAEAAEILKELGVAVKLLTVATPINKTLGGEEDKLFLGGNNDPVTIIGNFLASQGKGEGFIEQLKVDKNFSGHHLEDYLLSPEANKAISEFVSGMAVVLDEQVTKELIEYLDKLEYSDFTGSRITKNTSEEEKNIAQEESSTAKVVEAEMKNQTSKTESTLINSEDFKAEIEKLIESFQQSLLRLLEIVNTQIEKQIQIAQQETSVIPQNQIQASTISQVKPEENKQNTALSEAINAELARQAEISRDIQGIQEKYQQEVESTLAEYRQSISQYEQIFQAQKELNRLAALQLIQQRELSEQQFLAKREEIERQIAEKQNEIKQSILLDQQLAGIQPSENEENLTKESVKGTRETLNTAFKNIKRDAGQPKVDRLAALERLINDEIINITKLLNSEETSESTRSYITRYGFNALGNLRQKVIGEKEKTEELISERSASLPEPRLRSTSLEINELKFELESFIQERNATAFIQNNLPDNPDDDLDSDSLFSIDFSEAEKASDKLKLLFQNIFKQITDFVNLLESYIPKLPFQDIFKNFSSGFNEKSNQQPGKAKTGNLDNLELVNNLINDEISKITFNTSGDTNRIPKLSVLDSKSEAGAKYSASKNEVSLQKKYFDVLQKNPLELDSKEEELYTKALQLLTHELRHAAQAKYGLNEAFGKDAIKQEEIAGFNLLQPNEKDLENDYIRKGIEFSSRGKNEAVNKLEQDAYTFTGKEIDRIKASVFEGFKSQTQSDSEKVPSNNIAFDSAPNKVSKAKAAEDVAKPIYESFLKIGKRISNATSLIDEELSKSTPGQPNVVDSGRFESAMKAIVKENLPLIKEDLSKGAEEFSKGLVEQAKNNPLEAVETVKNVGSQVQSIVSQSEVPKENRLDINPLDVLNSAKNVISGSLTIENIQSGDLEKVQNELISAAKEELNSYKTDKNIAAVAANAEVILKKYKQFAIETSAIPEVEKRAEEVLSSTKASKKNDARLVSADPDKLIEELFITIGGYAGARGLSGARISRQLNQSLPDNKKAIYVKGEATDVPEDLPKKGDSLDSQIAAGNSLIRANAQGYSQDAIEIAAQALAAIKLNPDINIKILGESGGGFAAEDAANILKSMGLEKNVEYLSVGTPSLIGNSGNAKGKKIIGADDSVYLGVESILEKYHLLQEKAEPGLRGIETHPIEGYSQARAAELMNFVAGNPDSDEDKINQLYEDGQRVLKDAQTLDFTEYWLDDIVITAERLFDDIQILRRETTSNNASQETKDKLQPLIDEMLDAYINVANEDDDFMSAREGIKSIQQKIKDQSKQINEKGEDGAPVEDITKELIEQIEAIKTNFNSNFSGKNLPPTLQEKVDRFNQKFPEVTEEINKLKSNNTSNTSDTVESIDFDNLQDSVFSLANAFEFLTNLISSIIENIQKNFANLFNFINPFKSASEQVSSPESQSSKPEPEIPNAANKTPATDSVKNRVPSNSNQDLEKPILDAFVNIGKRLSKATEIIDDELKKIGAGQPNIVDSGTLEETTKEIVKSTIPLAGNDLKGAIQNSFELLLQEATKNPQVAFSKAQETSQRINSEVNSILNQEQIPEDKRLNITKEDLLQSLSNIIESSISIETIQSGELEDKLIDAVKEELLTYFSEENLPRITANAEVLLKKYKKYAIDTSAIPEVDKRAEEILSSDKASKRNDARLVAANPEQMIEELFIAIGGYAGARGLSGARISKQLNEVLPDNKKAIFVKGEATDVPKEVSDNQDAVNARIATGNSLVRANTLGYSQDAVEIAAQAFAAIKLNPNISIKIIGESGGGFAAEDAANILKAMGLEKNVEFLGVGTPTLSGSGDAKGNKIIGVDDPIYASVKDVLEQYGLLKEKANPELRGIEIHQFEGYFQAEAAELMNFIEGESNSTGEDIDNLYEDMEKLLKFLQEIKISENDPDDINNTAIALVNDIQALRRETISSKSTDATKESLQPLIDELLDVYIDLGNEDLDFSSARESLEGIQKKLKRENKKIDKLDIDQMSDEEILDNFPIKDITGNLQQQIEFIQKDFEEAFESKDLNASGEEKLERFNEKFSEVDSQIAELKEKILKKQELLVKLLEEEAEDDSEPDDVFSIDPDRISSTRRNGNQSRPEERQVNNLSPLEERVRNYISTNYAISKEKVDRFVENLAAVSPDEFLEVLNNELEVYKDLVNNLQDKDNDKRKQEFEELIAEGRRTVDETFYPEVDRNPNQTRPQKVQNFAERQINNVKRTTNEVARGYDIASAVRDINKEVNDKFGVVIPQEAIDAALKAASLNEPLKELFELVKEYRLGLDTEEAAARFQYTWMTSLENVQAGFDINNQANESSTTAFFEAIQNAASRININTGVGEAFGIIRGEISSTSGSLLDITDQARATGNNLNTLGGLFSTGFDAQDNLSEGLRNLGNNILPELGDKIVALAQGYLSFEFLQTSASFLKDYVFEALIAFKDFDRIITALNFTAGSAAKGADSLKLVRDQVNTLKIDFDSALEGFTQLQGAARGTTLQNDVNQLFDATTKVSTVLSLSQEGQSGVFSNFVDIISNGVVQTEKLRSLAEKIPGFFSLTARALSVSDQELNKLLRGGLLTADEFIPKIAERIQLEFSEAAKTASENFESSLFNVQNKLKEIQVSVGKAFSGLGAGVLNTIGEALKVVTDNSEEFATVLNIISTGLIVQSFKSILAAITTSIAGYSLLEVAIGGLTTALGAIARVLAPIILKWLALNLVIETGTALFKGFNAQNNSISQFADKLNGRIDSLSSSIKNLNGELDNLKNYQPPSANLFDNIGRSIDGLSVGGAARSGGVLAGGAGALAGGAAFKLAGGATAGMTAAAAGGVAAFSTAGLALLAAGAGYLINRTVSSLRSGDSSFYGYAELERDNRRISAGDELSKVSNRFAEESKKFYSLNTDANGKVIPGIKAKGELANIQSIDNQTTILLERKNLLGNTKADEVSRKAIDLELETLKNRRNEISQELNDFQTQLSATITDYDQLLAGEKDPQVAMQLQAELASLKQIQDTLNKVNISDSNPLVKLADAIEAVDDAIQEADANMRKFVTTANIGIKKNQLNLSFTDPLAASKSGLAETEKQIEGLQAKRNEIGSTVDNLKTQLQNPLFKEILKVANIDENSTSQEINSAIQKLEQDGKEGKVKSILQTLAKVKEEEQNLLDTDLEIIEAKINASEQSQEITLAEIDNKNAEIDALGANEKENTIASIRKQEQDGTLSEELASYKIAELEYKDLVDSIASTEEKLAQLRELKGKISAEEYISRERDLLTEVSSLRRQAVEQDIALSKQRLSAQLADIDRIYNANKQVLEGSRATGVISSQEFNTKTLDLGTRQLASKIAALQKAKLGTSNPNVKLDLDAQIGSATKELQQVNLEFFNAEESRYNAFYDNLLKTQEKYFSQGKTGQKDYNQFVLNTTREQLDKQEDLINRQLEVTPVNDTQATDELLAKRANIYLERQKADEAFFSAEQNRLSSHYDLLESIELSKVQKGQISQQDYNKKLLSLQKQRLDAELFTTKEQLKTIGNSETDTRREILKKQEEINQRRLKITQDYYNAEEARIAASLEKINAIQANLLSSGSITQGQFNKNKLESDKQSISEQLELINSQISLVPPSSDNTELDKLITKREQLYSKILESTNNYYSAEIKLVKDSEQLKNTELENELTQGLITLEDYNKKKFSINQQARLDQLALLQTQLQETPENSPQSLLIQQEISTVSGEISRNKSTFFNDEYERLSQQIEATTSDIRIAENKRKEIASQILIDTKNSADGQIEAEKIKLDASRETIKAEVEQEKRRKELLENAKTNLTDPRELEKNRQQLTSSIQKISDLNLSLADNELNLQENLNKRLQRFSELKIASQEFATQKYVSSLNKEKQANDLLSQSIENQKKLIDSRNNLQNSKNKFTETVAQAKFSESSSGLDLIKRRDDENTDPRVKAVLQQQIAAIFGNANISYYDALLQKQQQERDLQQIKNRQQLEQIRQQQVLLALETTSTELAASRAIMEQKIAVAKGKQEVQNAAENLTNAIRTGDRKQILEAQKQLNIAKEQLVYTYDNLQTATQTLSLTRQLNRERRAALEYERKAASVQNAVSDTELRRRQQLERVEALTVGVGKRFKGGAVQAGQPYLVGENKSTGAINPNYTELFVPTSSGRIYNATETQRILNPDGYTLSSLKRNSQPQTFKFNNDEVVTELRNLKNIVKDRKPVQNNTFEISQYDDATEKVMRIQRNLMINRL